MIEFPSLRSHRKLRHGFFTRRGGLSHGIYASLNCGFGSRDTTDLISLNRAHVAGMLGMSPEALVTGYQTHSTEVAILETVPNEPPKADALVTNSTGIVLGVLTADCAPVLLADPEAKVIGAAHAGWRGAYLGVLEATCRTMIGIGARLDHIRAVIGPTIQQSSYEVGPEFQQRLVEADGANSTFFKLASRQGYFMFDLPSYCAARLRQMGIENISTSEACTYHNQDDYFSYRRSVHRQELDYGRQISAITLGQPEL